MSKDWIEKATKNEGGFTRKAEERGMSPKEFSSKVRANPDEYDTKTVRQANLMNTLGKLRKKKQGN
jgi:hypothetical protein